MLTIGLMILTKGLTGKHGLLLQDLSSYQY